MLHRLYLLHFGICTFCRIIGLSLIKERQEQVMEKAKRLIPLLMLTFVFAGITGFIYEEICGFINEGEFFKRGTTYGPWIPIYGVGAILIFSAVIKIRNKPWLVFIVSALLCGALELSAGFILDKCFGIRLWDYSAVILNWGNVGGYICIRSVITWGLMGLFFISVMLPIFEKFGSKHPKAFNVVSYTSFGLFMLDVILSFTLNSPIK